MKIFYENLVGTVENVYLDKSTFENVFYLEDMINIVTTDIYVQYKKKTASYITYEYSNIKINGMIKIRNHLYFINNYRSTYNNFVSLNTNEDNTIKVVIKNSIVNLNTPYEIEIYVNGTLAETLKYADLYSLYNNKTIQLDSEILGTTITITFPLHLNIGEYKEYNIYTINVTEEVALHKYLCTFDRINNALIFSQKYKDDVINIILQSKGSILRASSINELYRLNSNSFVTYDENINRLQIPKEKLFKDGSVLKYIKTQYVDIVPNQLNVGYNLLGIYLSNLDTIEIDTIMYNVNYAELMENINNHQLDTLRKNRTYYGFIVGYNNINKFTPTDIQMYGAGAGGGGGTGGGVEKIISDFTSVEELTISYVAGTQVPTIVVFDQQGDQIVPETVHYNLSNEIKITFGELTSGQVSII